MENKFLCVPISSVNIHVADKYFLLSNDRAPNNSCLSSVSNVCNHQFRTGLVMRRNRYIKELSVIDLPLVALRWSHFGTALAPGHVRQVNNLVFWIDDATATRGQLGTWNRIRIESLESRETSRPHTTSPGMPFLSTQPWDMNNMVSSACSTRCSFL